MLKKYTLFLSVFLWVSVAVHSQNSSGFVRDMVTKEAIPYATLQVGPTYGTIANEEGGFSLVLAGRDGDSLLISSMGYEQKRIPLDALGQELVIYLNPSAIELDEVLLRNRQPTADEIIREVQLAYPLNYSSTDQKYKVFYRGTSSMHFDDLALVVEKASGIPRKQVDNASERLDSLARSIVESRLIEFRDYSGTLLLKNRDSSKITIDRATQLIDSKKEFSMDAVQRKAQNLILQYLDTTMTYKLKTGLFKIEDSLSFDKNDLVREVDSTFSKGEIRSSILGTLKMSQWYEFSFLDKILNLDSYRFKLDGASYFQGTPIYVVSFDPRKGSSKFSGKLYISSRDFAVLKADYAFSQGRRGKKFNMKLLLGVKYVEKVNKGTVIYKQGESGTYQPFYITRESGNYIYLHRPFKFIANSRGRDKVVFDFSMEGLGREKQELLVLSAEELISDEFKNLQEAEKVPFTVLNRFESSVWQDMQIIQPLEEMKNFGVSD